MHAFYDLYKLGDHGSAMWMGRVRSYDVALFEIELSAAKAPGDYLIVNEQSGQQNVLSFGLRLDGHVQSIGRGQVTVNAKSISGGPIRRQLVKFLSEPTSPLTPDPPFGENEKDRPP